MLKFTLFLISVLFLDCIVAAPVSNGKCCYFRIFNIFFLRKTKLDRLSEKLIK